MPAPVTVLDHPVIQTKLARLRDAATDHYVFRAVVEELALLMTYEVTRDWPTVERPIDTPLEATVGRVLARKVTLVPVLRAGLGLVAGMLRVLPEARVGHLGVRRDERTLEPISYYAKLPPDLAGSEVLLVDPMLATGGSAAGALSVLRGHGAASLKFVCLVAAPEGVACLQRSHPDVPIYCCAIDRQLDDKGYIRPGLGDAGDRVFGT